MRSKSLVATNSLIVVSPSLVSWSVDDPIVRTKLNSTALLTPKGWWIIDPISIADDTWEYFVEGANVLGILLTNENHERAACEIAEKRHQKIYAHEATSKHLKIHANYFFREGEILDGGLKAIHIPGATRGESCFYDARNRVLIVGDALIHLEETGFAFLPDKYCHDPVQAKSVLKKLLDLDFDKMTFAHGAPILVNAKVQLKKLLSR